MELPVDEAWSLPSYYNLPMAEQGQEGTQGVKVVQPPEVIKHPVLCSRFSVVSDSFGVADSAMC
eukprot:3087554-Rhodomonas_salina.1